MKERRSRKQLTLRLGIVSAVLAVLLGGCLSVELLMLRSARPPGNLKTIQDFKLWKAQKILGERRYENAGTNYMVMLAPAGRTLASGPSAYLFDPNGNFVDWTADMGDFETEKYRFKLSGDRVKRLEPGTR